MTVAPSFTGRENERFSVEPLGDGWVSWNIVDRSRFNPVLEPLQVRKEPPVGGSMLRGRLRMMPELRHSNLGDMVHGAVILAFIDVAIFAVPAQHGLLGDGFSVTLDLSTQFVGGGRLNEPLDAVTEVVRTTGRLIFVRGLVVQGADDKHIVASFNATVRKPPPAKG